MLRLSVSGDGESRCRGGRAATCCTALHRVSVIWVIEGRSHDGATLPLMRRSIFFYDWRDPALPRVLGDLHHAPATRRVEVNVRDRTLLARRAPTDCRSQCHALP